MKNYYLSRKFCYCFSLTGLLLFFACWLASAGQHVAAQAALADNERLAIPATTLPAPAAGQPAVIGTGPHAAITANDLFLAGTQPGGLTSRLADSTTCTYCHVEQIVDEYGGSMMANSARDPLFRAALQVANRDLPGSGEFCLRCHSPNGWLEGRASGDGADGSKLTAMDLQGVTCTTCHRLVPPTAIAGESPRDAVERDHVLTTVGVPRQGSGAYILDREEYRRGPYQVTPPHGASQSSYLRTAELCATCHDIDNPLLSFDAGLGEFAFNAMNTPASHGDQLFPIERTYSEWAASDFANGGVTGLPYPGLRRATFTEDGPITVCQDCHMPMIRSAMALGGDEREVGIHRWAGGNSRWQLGIVALWKDVKADRSFSAEQTHAAAEAGADMLQRAATLELAIVDNELAVNVINQTGHKLPTGYAEGRRMWLQVTAFVGATAVYTAGVPVAGEITGATKVYEIKQGVTERHAAALARTDLAGAGFHFILNNTVISDNRIPPRGYRNDQFAARDMAPVGYSYADGQYWDTTHYAIPLESTRIEVKLLFQSASPAYLDFLEREANVTVADAVLGEINWGATVGELRRDLALTTPAVMATAALTPTFVAPAPELLYLPLINR